MIINKKWCAILSKLVLISHWFSIDVSERCACVSGEGLLQHNTAAKSSSHQLGNTNRQKLLGLVIHLGYHNMGNTIAVRLLPL